MYHNKVHCIPASVEIPILSMKYKGLRIPTSFASRNYIVMSIKDIRVVSKITLKKELPVEQYSWASLIFFAAAERSQYQWIDARFSGQ